MAIRIREIGGRMVALCAACSIPKEGDIYLDDNIHAALSAFFALDFNSMHGLVMTLDQYTSAMMDIEESTNIYRDQWEKDFGSKK